MRQIVSNSITLWLFPVGCFSPMMCWLSFFILRQTHWLPETKSQIHQSQVSIGPWSPAVITSCHPSSSNIVDHFLSTSPSMRFYLSVRIHTEVAGVIVRFIYISTSAVFMTCWALLCALLYRLIHSFIPPNNTMRWILILSSMTS